MTPRRLLLPLALIALGLPARGQDIALSQILIDGEPWRRVEGHLGPIVALAADPSGAVYATVKGRPGIIRVDGDSPGKPIAADAGNLGGLAAGPEGRIYACQPEGRRIVAIRPEDGGKSELVAEGVGAKDLVVTASGSVYATI